MNVSLFALPDLAEPRVSLQWFEAVAVTLGMAETWPDQATRVAPFDAFTLTSDGTVRPLPGAKATSTPSRELGRALQALLVDTAAPHALRELGHDAAQAAPVSPVSPFLRALAFFERPDRARIIHFLAQRVAPELEHVNVDEELRRLEARARERAERERPPTRWELVRAALLKVLANWRAWVPATALVLLVLTLATIVYRSPILRSTVKAPITRVAEFVQSVVPSGTKPVEKAAEAAPAAETVEARGPKRRATSGRDVPAVDALAAPATSGLPEEPIESTFVPMPPPREIEILAAPRRASGAQMDDGTPVFREGDPGVIAPRLTRSYLPEFGPAGVPDEMIGVFELIVDEQGSVERARLLSPTNRFQERMLVSAAKAWQFEPALLDGAPVKFITHVRVTW